MNIRCETIRHGAGGTVGWSARGVTLGNQPSTCLLRAVLRLPPPCRWKDKIGSTSERLVLDTEGNQLTRGWVHSSGSPNESARSTRWLTACALKGDGMN